MQKKPSKNTGKKTTNKVKPPSPVENTPSKHITGLDGNQLLKAINKECDETPMKLCILSAMHENTQDQVNRSSQRLCEKAVLKLKSQNTKQNTDMEGIEAGPSQTPI